MIASIPLHLLLRLLHNLNIVLLLQTNGNTLAQIQLPVQISSTSPVKHSPNHTTKKEISKTYLPLLHLILLRLILLDQFLERLLQSIRIRLQNGHDFLDRPLGEDAVDHAEAFAIIGEGG